MSGTYKQDGPVNQSDLEVARVMRSKSRRSFLVLGLGATAGHQSAMRDQALWAICR